MSIRKWICSLFRKPAKPPVAPLTPAEHAQRIRGAIPAALAGYDGVEILQNMLMAYAGQNHELVNALNKSMRPKDLDPDQTPDYGWLAQLCDHIESGGTQKEVLDVLNLVNY